MGENQKYFISLTKELACSTLWQENVHNIGNRKGHIRFKQSKAQYLHMPNKTFFHTSSISYVFGDLVKEDVCAQAAAMFANFRIFNYAGDA